MALALMGLGLTATLGLVRLQDQAQEQAAARQESLRLARGVMDHWLQAASLKPGRKSGSQDGLEWSVTVRRLARGDEPPGGGGGRPSSPQLQAAPSLFSLEVCCRRPGRDRGVCLSCQHTALEAR